MYVHRFPFQGAATEFPVPNQVTRLNRRTPKGQGRDLEIAVLVPHQATIFLLGFSFREALRFRQVRYFLIARHSSLWLS